MKKGEGRVKGRGAMIGQDAMDSPGTSAAMIWVAG